MRHNKEEFSDSEIESSVSPIRKRFVSEDQTPVQSPQPFDGDFAFGITPSELL